MSKRRQPVLKNENLKKLELSLRAALLLLQRPEAGKHWREILYEATLHVREAELHLDRYLYLEGK